MVGLLGRFWIRFKQQDQLIQVVDLVESKSQMVGHNTQYFILSLSSSQVPAMMRCHLRIFSVRTAELTCMDLSQHLSTDQVTGQSLGCRLIPAFPDPPIRKLTNSQSRSPKRADNPIGRRADSVFRIFAISQQSWPNWQSRKQFASGLGG